MNQPLEPCPTREGARAARLHATRPDRLGRLGWLGRQARRHGPDGSISRTSLRVLLLLLPVVGAGSARADLLVNGSFEAPVVPVGSFTNFPSGSTAISGWTVVGVDSAIVNGSFIQSGILFRAQAGNQYIDLAGVTSNSQSSGVTQTVATTVGLAYQLRFHVGSAQGGGFFFPSTFDLSLNDGPRVAHTNPATPTNALDWMAFSVPFVATTPTTKITFFNGGASNNFNSALDGVSLELAPTAVPTLGLPGAAALLGALALLASARPGPARR